MPATMDKKDVLYRVAYKNNNSIKWATITKLAGKETPQQAKDEIRRFLDDEKNNKMEAKLGIIRKGKKNELVLRIKNGSKHLYETVLDKDYTRKSESEKGEFDNEQRDKLKAALKEIKVVWDQTDTFVGVLKSLNTELDTARKAHETLISKFNPQTITRPQWMNFELISNNRKRDVGDIGTRGAKALEDHKKEISGFRSGGAGRIATKHGLDEDRRTELAKRFTQHSKHFAGAEQKTKSLEQKVKQLQNEIAASIKLFDANADKTEAIKDYLASCLSTWNELLDAQRRNHFSKQDMEKYLTYDAKKKDVVAVEAGIDFVDGKLESAEKVFVKTTKRINEVLKTVPQPSLKIQGIVERSRKSASSSPTGAPICKASSIAATPRRSICKSFSKS